MEDVSLSYEKITHLYKDGNIIHSDAWNEKKQAASPSECKTASQSHC